MTLGGMCGGLLTTLFTEVDVEEQAVELPTDNKVQVKLNVTELLNCIWLHILRLLDDARIFG